MTGLPRHARRLWVWLMPFMAATLACNALAGGGPSPSAALTQAAATVQAATVQAATAQAAVPTSVPDTATVAPSTVPPTAASTAAPAGSPTAAATATENSTATPAASPAVSATTQSGAAVILDPCTLISADEAHTLVGVDLQPARQQGGSCTFNDQFATHGLAVYALPPSQAQGFFQQFLGSLKQSGVTIDPAAETKLNQDLTAGDLVAATNDLAGMTLSQTKFKAQKLDGLGSTALSLFTSYDQLKVADDAIIAAQPGGMVALSIIVSTPIKQADMEASMRPFVTRILAGLPPDFQVKGLQIAGSAPAIDPCALATADDIQAIMGVKPGAGQPSQGECFYTAASDPQTQLRIFALPPGQGATEAITQLQSLLLITDATAKAKLAADAAAYDFVAVVKDIGAAPPSFLGKPESVDGLGDAATFLLGATPGSPRRIGYLVAAKPGVIVGVTLFLGAGDNAAAKDASIALVTNILKSLPDKFTVTGAP